MRSSSIFARASMRAPLNSRAVDERARRVADVAAELLWSNEPPLREHLNGGEV